MPLKLFLSTCMVIELRNGLIKSKNIFPTWFFFGKNRFSVFSNKIFKAFLKWNFLESFFWKQFFRKNVLKIYRQFYPKIFNLIFLKLFEFFRFFRKLFRKKFIDRILLSKNLWKFSEKIFAIFLKIFESFFEILNFLTIMTL